MSDFSSIRTNLIVAFILLVFGVLNFVDSSGIIFLIFGALWFSLYSGIGLGALDYRGTPSKSYFRIGRYVLAGLLSLGFVGILVTDIQNSGLEYLSKKVIEWTFDLSIILYLFCFKPSDCTIGKKILKVVGMVMMYFAVFTLTQVTETRYEMYYWMSEPRMVTQMNYGVLIFSAVIYAIGLICNYFGFKKKDISETSPLEVQIS